MRFGKILFQLCVLVGCGVVMAADAPAPAPSAPGAVDTPATQPADTALAPFRDPTEPDAALRKALENLRPLRSGRGRTPAVPQVIRRALVKVKGQPPEALIEVQTALYFVREGSAITVSNADGSTIMHIKRMTEDEIEIEIDVESQKQTMIVR